MDQFGTTEAQFAEAAVSCRAWASQHPKAQMRDLISVDDVLNSRAIADPLKVLDCSLVSDGGAAVVITRKDQKMDPISPSPCWVTARDCLRTHQPGQRPDDVCRSAVGSCRIRRGGAHARRY